MIASEAIAQLVARLVRIEKVRGSIPLNSSTRNPLWPATAQPEGVPSTLSCWGRAQAERERSRGTETDPRLPLHIDRSPPLHPERRVPQDGRVEHQLQAGSRRAGRRVVVQQPRPARRHPRPSTVELPKRLVHKWQPWALAHGSSTQTIESLISAGGGASSWRVYERSVPSSEWVEVLNRRTGELYGF